MENTIKNRELPEMEKDTGNPCRKKLLKKIIIHISGMALYSLFITVPVFANASGALSGLESFRDFIADIISLVGSFYLLWGIFEFANSLMGNDGIMQASAFKKIAGGFIAMAAPEIYKFFA